MKSRNQQIPLGSGFNQNSTTKNVLKDIDLTGKIAVITGGHSGLGLESTHALQNSGAHVIVGSRDMAAARKTLAGIKNIEIVSLDLADLNSVKRFASALTSSLKHIDILINNAGIMACPEQRIGPEKWEAQFAVNHLGHFSLVNHLYPLLAGGSRVIVVSSSGHHNSAIRWEDINFNNGYDKWLAYGQSKTANVLFAVHLDQLGKAHGVRSFALHPGKIFTPLQRYLTVSEMTDEGWLHADGAPADPTFKSIEQGAATQVWAATSPLLSDLGGLYCEDCDIASIANDNQPFVGVKCYATDPEQAARLWDISARLTGVNRI